MWVWLEKFSVKPRPAQPVTEEPGTPGRNPANARPARPRDLRGFIQMPLNCLTGAPLPYKRCPQAPVPQITGSFQPCSRQQSG